MGPDDLVPQTLTVLSNWLCSVDHHPWLGCIRKENDMKLILSVSVTAGGVPQWWGGMCSAPTVGWCTDGGCACMVRVERQCKHTFGKNALCGHGEKKRNCAQMEKYP